jgi:hypothetical protein
VSAYEFPVTLKEPSLPVTARLSKQFYERLGEDVATELVDWLNAMDAASQRQLREINELNFDRLRSEFRGELRTEIGSVRADIAILRTEIEAKLDSKTSNLRADLIKWMFTFYTATVVSLGGLIVALEKLFK